MADALSGSFGGVTPLGRPERRAATRFPVALAVRVRRIDGQPADVGGVTRNASREGVYLMLDTGALAERAPIEFDMSISEGAFAHCTGRVVRSNSSDERSGRSLVAATIERYRIRRASA